MSFNIFFFIFTISAARLLGPEKWGLITLLSLFATYSSIFTFGVTNGMGILLPIALGKDQKEENYIAENAFWCLVFSFIITGAVQILFIINVKIPLSYFLFLVAYTFSIQLLNFLKVYLRSHQNFTLFSYAYFFQTMILLMGFYLIKININYLMILSLINLFTVIFIYSRIKKKKQNWSINKKQVTGLIKVGFPIMIAGIVGELLLSTDRLLISYFFDNIELGLYGFASNFFKGVRVIGIAISIITLPKIATSYSKSDFESMLYFTGVQQWISFALMITSSVVTILVVFKLFPIFMPEYLRSVNLIIIFLIAASLLPLSKYANILNVIGKQGLYLKAQIFIILTNIIFSRTLIHLGYGIEGVAIASLLSMILYVSLIRYLGSRAIKSLISKV